MHCRTAAILVSAALIMSAGCDYAEEPILLGNMPAQPIEAYSPQQTIVQPTDPSVARRFTGESSGTPDAVQSAVMWSDKYEELVGKYKALTEENMSLTKEKYELQKKLLLMDDELKRTRQEVEEANLFMQEMYAELTQWKGDVLGFRDEIRLSQGAQLQALTKILRLLGAEVAESAAARTALEERP